MRDIQEQRILLDDLVASAGADPPEVTSFFATPRALCPQCSGKSLRYSVVIRTDGTQSVSLEELLAVMLLSR